MKVMPIGGKKVEGEDRKSEGQTDAQKRQK